VAEVAAIALTQDKLAHGTFELCAEPALTREDVAAAMGDVLGRPVAAVQPNFGDWAAATRLPYDDRQLALLAAVYAHYDRHGSPGNDLVLRTILGREPRGLRAYVQDLAAGVATTA